jgi:hypothetical protein
MATPVTLDGNTIQAIVSAKSSFSSVSDGFGGFQRNEGNRMEVMQSDLDAILAGTIHTGQLVVIPGDYNQYRVTKILPNGDTATLILGSTSGTGAQF